MIGPAEWSRARGHYYGVCIHSNVPSQGGLGAGVTKPQWPGTPGGTHPWGASPHWRIQGRLGGRVCQVDEISGPVKSTRSAGPATHESVLSRRSDPWLSWPEVEVAPRSDDRHKLRPGIVDCARTRTPSVPVGTVPADPPRAPRGSGSPPHTRRGEVDMVRHVARPGCFGIHLACRGKSSCPKPDGRRRIYGGEKLGYGRPPPAVTTPGLALLGRLRRNGKPG